MYAEIEQDLIKYEFETNPNLHREKAEAEKALKDQEI